MAEEKTDPAPNPEPSPKPEPSQKPPSAKAVIEGKTEREIELERKLEESERGRKKAETDAAHAQDEAHRLKKVQSGPAPVPQKKKEQIRWTLLHPVDEEA